MKYGAMNFPIKSVRDELTEIGALGFDYLELTMDPPQAHYTTLQQQRQTIVNDLHSRGMSIICHLPTFVSTADLTDSIRQASLQEMFHSLEVAAEMGAQKVVLHPGHIGGLGIYVEETALVHANNSLAAIIEHAQKLELCVCLENMFPRCRAFVEPDDFVDILQRFPELKLTLDTGHANIGAKGGQRILQFIEKFGHRIGHLHISDNLGERDDHAPLGSGIIDFKTIARAIKHSGYDDTATLEIFSENRQALVQSRQRFDDILKSC
ncbi:MAG: sugar phosphate isomerase/epimerase [Desulfobacterales bacterium]|jgi:sugar phosphate isomerase/epimerase